MFSSGFDDVFLFSQAPKENKTNTNNIVAKNLFISKSPFVFDILIISFLKNKINLFEYYFYIYFFILRLSYLRKNKIICKKPKKVVDILNIFAYNNGVRMQSLLGNVSFWTNDETKVGTFVK